MGTVDVPLLEEPALKAFFNDAREPLREAKKPGVDPMEVPVVTIDEEDPLLNLPILGLSNLLFSS